MTGTPDRLQRRGLAPALVTVVALLVNGGCERSGATADTVPGQWYRVALATEAGDSIPFFLRVPDNCEGAAATVLNGEERLGAGCRRSPVGFVVEFPVYGTRLEAWFKPDASLVGHWCREGPKRSEPILALEAEPVSQADPNTRFRAASTEKGQPHAEVTGDWRMVFEVHGMAKGVFLQESSGVVTGSIEPFSSFGDLRFLAGNVVGSKMRLSTFDGQRAFMLEGEIGPDGTLEGEWIRHDSRDRFVAERDDHLETPDPLDRVAFTPDDRKLDFEPLHDPKFDGQAVIVHLFGTWCPNCNDHAPVLVDLYRSHRARGLEMLGLAYEYVGERDHKERRVQEFKKKHGIAWDIVIADATLEELASEGLAGLAPIEGVPVTIFLNRDHTVHAIYSGFSGPATGESHLKAKARFANLTSEILSGL